MNGVLSNTFAAQDVYHKMASCAPEEPGSS